LRDERGAGRPRATMRAFNAGLVLNDERDLPRPYLAEAVPQLNTDSWRVEADGRMTTTYRLKPNLTWHDGRPLTAEDFAFAHRVYAVPEFGLVGTPPTGYMEAVEAPDPRTVVIRWRQPYALADSLVMVDFLPLPRHLLEASFAQGNPDAFVALPYWSTEYVGLGPYKLSRIEHGVAVDALPFDGHSLGRAKIDQLRFTYISDANTALANLLSDVGHVATDGAIDLQQAAVLDREWGPRNAGTVLRSPTGVRHVNFQMRPEFSTPKTLQDLRVRKALAHLSDRQALAEALTDGLGPVADTLVMTQMDYYSALDQAIAKYPYDVRRAEQLLNEAGYTKGSDGFYTSLTEGRFSMEVAVAQGGRNDNEVAIMADGLRRNGLDTSIRIIPRAQITDPFVLAHFPGVLIGSHNPASVPPVQRVRASEIATNENRGRGSNYSGWTHPQAERLIAAYETALDRNERNQQIIQLLKLVSEEIPLYPLYFNLEFLAHAGALRGPQVTVSNDSATWNLHEWYWTQ
jgi:peptide/nickel transport system substrate-binding protein